MNFQIYLIDGSILTRFAVNVDAMILLIQNEFGLLKINKWIIVP